MCYQLMFVNWRFFIGMYNHRLNILQPLLLHHPSVFVFLTYYIYCVFILVHCYLSGYLICSNNLTKKLQLVKITVLVNCY